MHEFEKYLMGPAADARERVLVRRILLMAPAGPSGPSHADAFRSCAPHLLDAVARDYPRPFDHPFFDLYTSDKCNLRLFGIWKAGHTLLDTLVQKLGTSKPPVLCDDAKNWHDHLPLDLRSIPRNSHSAAARKQHVHMILKQHEWRSTFSTALTREPSERFLSGYHEHFSHCAIHGDAISTSIGARMTALEAFVDAEAAFVPGSAFVPSPAGPFASSNQTPVGCLHNRWERDMHVAPQMVFLTHTMGGNRTSASNGSTVLTGARATPRTA